MKLHTKQRAAHRGSALACTLLICALVGTLVASYLYLLGTQNLSVVRSQNWNQSLVVAEAGVDEALALMNSGVQSNSFVSLPLWTSAGGGVFKNDTNRPACKFGTSYYQVFITNSFIGSNPVVVARGYVPGPVGSPVLSRTVRVQTQPRTTFPVKGPMIVVQGFNANGNNVGTDSFDSTVGPYNPTNAGALGDVICLTTNANSLAIGNGKINGTVRTPPGGVQGITATVGSNGSVGDNAYVSGGSTGFEAGHFQDNFTLGDFPDATLPNAPVWYLPTSGTAPDGLTYNNLLTGGNYQIANLTGSVYVGQPNTVLYVTTSINIGSGGGGTAAPQIYIAPGASLTVYMGGATTSINGNGLVNATGQAKNFQYYGLPGNTTINITGNGAFYGTIYAPEADLNLKGSGNTSTDDFTGASITKTTTMTGNFNFHYDQSLVYLTTLGGYDATGWQEL